MALRKREKGFWHAYFVRWERSGTSLRKRQVEVCLYTHDRDVARKLENDLMQKARTASLEARAGAKIEALLNGTDVQRVTKSKRRLKVSDALERASRYAAVGESAQKVWRRFVRESGFVYMDEIRPEDALAYLEKRYSGEKVYNNARCALNGIFKLLLVDAGLAESPFDRIHARRFTARASVRSRGKNMNASVRRHLRRGRKPFKSRGTPECGKRTFSRFDGRKSPGIAFRKHRRKRRGSNVPW